MSSIFYFLFLRSGNPLATVSIYSPAMLENDLDKSNAHVTGDLSVTNPAHAGELGYLHVTWSMPTDAQIGQYECSVHGVTASGHSVSFSKNLEVKKSEVYLSDLIAEIQDIKRNNTAQQTTIDSLQRDNTLQQTAISYLLSQTASQHTTISDLQSKLTAQNAKITGLQSQVDESRHVESGYLRCGDSHNWSSTSARPGYRGSFGKQKVMSATFQRDFSRPPVVFMSTSYLHIDQQYTHNLGTQILSVSTHSFTMRCGTHPLDWVYDIEISWIAISA